MKRSVVVFVLLVACGSKAPNPWAVKKWDTASLVAWVDACAETTGTKTDEGRGQAVGDEPQREPDQAAEHEQLLADVRPAARASRSI
jgi:hypothetical protein